MIDFLKKFYDVMMPRFITEYVVLVEQHDGYHPLCSLDDLEVWEFHKSMAFQKWRSFNLFGQAILPKAIGETWQVDSFDEIKSLP